MTPETEVPIRIFRKIVTTENNACIADIHYIYDEELSVLDVLSYAIYPIVNGVVQECETLHHDLHLAARIALASVLRDNGVL